MPLKLALTDRRAVRPAFRRQHVEQRRVCQRQPAARRVTPLVTLQNGWEESSCKIREQRPPSGWNGNRNAVDFMAACRRQRAIRTRRPFDSSNNRRVQARLVSLGYCSCNVFQEIVVNLEDNLQVTGQYFPQHIDRRGSPAPRSSTLWLV